MSIWRRIFRQRTEARPGRPAAHGRARLAAKYDAAQTTTDNSRHWANADDLAPDAAASPDVRRILRRRGRYEQFNNPYTDGILQTLASDIVGNGPRLQMQTVSETVNALIETEFHEWCEAIGLSEKLRLMIETRAAAGECFARMVVNPRLPTNVKLDLVLYEPDQVATPDQRVLFDLNETDGIEFDAYGNPSVYHVLKQHPGDTAQLVAMPLDYERVPADEMIHLFKPRRPGQRRGIPQITSALPLFADRRGFQKSVVAAARVAAEMGAVMLETDLPGHTDSFVEGEAFDTLDIERGMMTVSPAGYKAKQLDAKQPTTTYSDFDDKMINETARPLNMPFNVAACNSSKYNYASGRLDHQTYDRSIEVDHGDLERKVLNRVLARWMSDALRIPGYLPFRTASLVRRRIPHDWLWRGRDHVDPVKEAQAEKIKLASGTLTLADSLARAGKDVESHIATKKKEAKLLADAGLTKTEPLTGPQLTGAVTVLTALAQGLLTQEAAVELLVSVGMPRDKAEAACENAPSAPPVPSPKPSTNGNGNGNGRPVTPVSAGRLS